MQILGGIKKFIDSKSVPKAEDFEEKGFLSPELFVEAGDQITNFGWKWEKALNKPSKLMTNPNKQFLVSKANSSRRIKQIMNEQVTEEMINGFMVPVFKGTANEEESREEDYRIYQISITYDEYYHTPRLWLAGNDYSGKPLTSKQIFEDIMSEYQNETVTEETHPFLECRMLTVHPCKHSEVFKKFIDEAKSHKKKIKPHMALLIFLKFMGSVMPTIHYDYTIDIEI